jgi:hypothetical protein
MVIIERQVQKSALANGQKLEELDKSLPPSRVNWVYLPRGVAAAWSEDSHGYVIVERQWKVSRHLKLPYEKALTNAEMQAQRGRGADLESQQIEFYSTAGVKARLM